MKDEGWKRDGIKGEMAVETDFTDESNMTVTDWALRRECMASKCRNMAYHEYEVACYFHRSIKIWTLTSFPWLDPDKCTLVLLRSA